MLSSLKKKRTKNLPKQEALVVKILKAFFNAKKNAKGAKTQRNAKNSTQRHRDTEKNKQKITG